MLEHVEDPDEVQLAIREWKSLRRGEAEVDTCWRGFGSCQCRAADVAAGNDEVRTLALDRFGDRSPAASNVEHVAVNAGKVLEQVAQLDRKSTRLNSSH